MFGWKYANGYAASGMIILDRVVTKIVNDAVQYLGDPPQRSVCPFQSEGDIQRRCSSVKTVNRVFSNTVQVTVFPLQFCATAVKFCQIDNVFDKFRHAGGFAAYLCCEGFDILFFDHPVFK